MRAPTPSHRPVRADATADVTVTGPDRPAVVGHFMGLGPFVGWAAYVAAFLLYVAVTDVLRYGRFDPGLGLPLVPFMAVVGLPIAYVVGWVPTALTVTAALRLHASLGWRFGTWSSAAATGALGAAVCAALSAPLALAFADDGWPLVLGLTAQGAVAGAVCTATFRSDGVTRRHVARPPIARQGAERHRTAASTWIVAGLIVAVMAVPLIHVVRDGARDPEPDDLPTAFMRETRRAEKASRERVLHRVEEDARNRAAIVPTLDCRAATAEDRTTGAAPVRCRFVYAAPTTSPPAP